MEDVSWRILKGVTLVKLCYIVKYVPVYTVNTPNISFIQLLLPVLLHGICGHNQDQLTMRKRNGWSTSQRDDFNTQTVSFSASVSENVFAAAGAADLQWRTRWSGCRRHSSRGTLQETRWGGSVTTASVRSSPCLPDPRTSESSSSCFPSCRLSSPLLVSNTFSLLSYWVTS